MPITWRLGKALAKLGFGGISESVLRDDCSDRELLPAPEQAQALFTAYLLEKALYELLYELNNRPTWLRIPIGGILSM